MSQQRRGAWPSCPVKVFRRTFARCSCARDIAATIQDTAFGRQVPPSKCLGLPCKKRAVSMSHATFISAEALGLLEIDGVPRALRSQDAALKRAPITVLACAPVSPSKVVLIFAGDVASVEESL